MINQFALIFWNVIFPHCPLLTLHKNIAQNIEYFGSYIVQEKKGQTDIPT